MRKILFILLVFICVTSRAQTVLTLVDSAYVSTNTEVYGGPTISLASPTIFTFRNNSITAVCADGYFLQCGTDINGANDGHFDGAVIEGNKFDWNGTQTSPTPNTHGILMGYNKNYHTRHNYLDQVPLSVVVEGTGITYTEGGFYYNVLKKGWKNGLTSMGVNDFRIYNNTFIKGSMGSAFGMIKIEYMEQTTPDYMTHDHKIKNNIFYSSTSAANFISIDSSAVVGFECDYNLYWVEGTANHEPTFYNTKTFQTYTWTEWKALGYDAHSVVADPKFIDTISYIPSVRLDYGTDLGDEYDNGLAPTAEWVVGTYPDTVSQDATWQVGAYILDSYTADYYVAPDGDDDAAGTIAAPWATFTKAFQTAQPGDTVYFRGGTYNSDVVNGTGIQYNPSSSIGHDGERNNRILYAEYPGEEVILDFSNTTSTPNVYNYGWYIANVDHVTFRGFTITGLNQLDDLANHPGAYDIIVGVESVNCSNTVFEQMTVHSLGGIGFRTSGVVDTVYFTNCDAYNLCDTLHLTLPGSYGTGFSPTGTTDSLGVVILTGCRAWMCSDQGFSSPSGHWTIFNSCWSFNNNNTLGGGIGFKTSANSDNLLSDSRIAAVYREFNNCVAANNKGPGWTTNEVGPYRGYRINYYNNIAYNNGGMGFTTNLVYDATRNYTNNIAYANHGAVDVQIRGATNTEVTNSWNGGVTVTTADFLSVDSAGMAGARQSDGSLPDLDFMKLVEGSDLIDAGTDVGLSFSGSAPDLGAFEYDGEASTATDILTFTLPTQTGAATINTTNHTVAIEVAYTADITSLTPTITLSYGATVIPLSGVARDFTNPVPYTVTAEDGVTTQEWTVTVTQEAEPVTPVPTGGAIVKFNGKIVKR